MHQAIEPSALLQQEVDTAHDAEYAKREDPNPNDGHDTRLSSNEPAEETEHGGDDVDDQDGARELPRGDRGPERSIGTGDEDEPVLRKGDLQEEDLVHDTEVLDDTAILALRKHGGESDPSADREDYTQHDRHTPETGEVPLDRLAVEGCVIVGDGQCCDISENSNEDDKLEVERVVQDGDPQTQEDFQM